MPASQVPAKQSLRRELLRARAELGPTARTDAATRLSGHLLAAPEVRAATTVACYVSIGSEPGTAPLLRALREMGRRVLLPVLLEDGDLDWAEDAGEAVFTTAARGLREPTGPRLGVEAVAAADVVLVPGLAASPAGLRLGRGGGSYDRALARLGTGAWTCVLLHDGETARGVPAEPHDRAVAAAVTPTGGLTRF